MITHLPHFLCTGAHENFFNLRLVYLARTTKAENLLDSRPYVFHQR